MSTPTVAQAEAWNPDALRDIADEWDSTAADLRTRIDTVVRAIDGSRRFWTGSAADAARDRGTAIGGDGALVTRCLIAAAVAARDGAEQIGSARDDLLTLLAVTRDQSPVLTSLAGGNAAVTADVLDARIDAALEKLGAADSDAAHDVTEALSPAHAPKAPTNPAGWTVPMADAVAGWSAIGQDRIASQIATMTAEQRQRLVDEFPRQVGNTDGIPWDMRIAANRVNIAQAIADEQQTNQPGSTRRVEFYKGLLAEIDDPTGSGRRIDRQILAFDPDRASLLELNGNLASARSLTVMVPGMNTTIEASAANTTTARRFVSATKGEVAAITYLGGPFPGADNLAAGVADAADPRYALDMAPRLVAFSEDVARTVDATGRNMPVTYIGHSYGGSIMGTAEEFGLTADRTLYLAAAGAGVGVDDPSDWHNRNPDVLRFSMTAPGDPIELVQGNPASPHGADPDDMPGVITLAAGDYDDGRPMAGPRAHTDIVNAPSDSWRNILAVITGDSATLHKAG